MDKDELIIEIGTGYTSIPSKVGAATEIVVEELTRSLQKAGKNVVIFDVNDKDRIPSNLPIHEVYVPAFIAGKSGYNLGIFHKLKRVFYSFSLSFSLNRFIKKDKSYVIHFHNQYNFFFFWLFSTRKKRKNARLFYTTHSGIWSKPWDEIKDKVNIKYFMESFAMKHADASFLLNESTMLNITQHLGIPPQTLHLMPNGVNTSIYRKLEKNDNSVIQLKKKLGVENKTIIFLAGTIESRKNQLAIIEYLAPLLRTNPNLVFLYAGGIRDQEYFSSIESYCKAEGLEQQVRYLGELAPGNNLNTYYNISDAFILASKFEAFPLVTLEALASGLPVLLSNNLMINFFRQENTGIFNFGSPEDLHKIIITEILDKEKQALHANRARLFIENNFSWDLVTQKYFN